VINKPTFNLTGLYDDVERVRQERGLLLWQFAREAGITFAEPKTIEAMLTEIARKATWAGLSLDAYIVQAESEVTPCQ
jgi:hypothetical protein